MNQDKSLSPTVFPLMADVNKLDHLSIGGLDCVDLCKEYGTPLYIFDELTIRTKCREFKNEFTSRHSNSLVAFASKAFLNRAIAQIIKEEGLGLDVVSGGELSVANSIGFPLNRIYFHGNNKTPEELKLALQLGIGRIVVDNFHELELLNNIAKDMGINQDILIRIAPGVDAHTHKHTTTGTLDSKFGFPLSTGQAEAAVNQSLSASNVNLVGIHFHLGSPVSHVDPYELAIDLTLQFAKQMKTNNGFDLQEFVPGGGFAVQYTSDSSVLSIADYSEAIITRMTSKITELGLTPPRLIVEPGRAIVAQAGVALYTVGAIKDIPNIRKYICVDGGMGDNIRPALYDAKYEALVANKVTREKCQKVSIAGKYCESGDILNKDVYLPDISPGDIIAIPVSGAYNIPMGSNYNMVPRPAIIMINNGKSRIIRKREGYQDLMRLDLI
jgi:diaminopimelate decarboxylase